MAERDDSGRPVPFRGGGFLPRSLGVVGPLVLLAVIGIREVGSRAGLIPALVLPAPSEALAALADLLESGLLWKHVSASVQRLVLGWTPGTVLGIAGVAILSVLGLSVNWLIARAERFLLRWRL